MAPPELVDDAIAEILLRLPLDEPRDLFRASVVCKPWRRLLTDAAFLRRYRRFHRAPPLLGFFFHSRGRGKPIVHHFIPTTAAASPFPRPVLDCQPWSAFDCRHGRVLLFKMPGIRNLAVWDPITGDQEELQHPKILCKYFSAAVFCAVAGCDHSDCHGGPFLVVWVSKGNGGIACACVYSSEVGSWGAPVYVHVGSVGDHDFIIPSRGTLVGDGIYFTLMSARILKYDFVKHHLSVTDLPEPYNKGVCLVPTEDGLLGIACVKGSSLYLWLRKMNAQGVEGWVQCRAIDLRTLLPVDDNPFVVAFVIGFAESTRSIFISTDVGIFVIELNSGRVRKVSEPGIYYPVVPFMSFYTPDCACSKLPLPSEKN